MNEHIKNELIFFTNNRLNLFKPTMKFKAYFVEFNQCFLFTHFNEQNSDHII